MAGITGGRCVRVVVVGVALRACYGCVRPSQWIVRVECVIKACCGPVRGRVTSAAVMREPELHMRRIITARKIRRVARITSGRRSRKHVIDVACGARKRRMHTCQCVARILQVVKLGVEPAVHGMTAFACRRKAKTDMINYFRRKVLLVA